MIGRRARAVVFTPQIGDILGLFTEIFRPEHVEEDDDKADELADVAEEDEGRHEGVEPDPPWLGGGGYK